MIRKQLLLLLSLVLWPAAAMADLSGIWDCTDGGRYYLRQSDNVISWYGEQKQKNPAWTNVFVGRINEDQVLGTWHDIPKGTTRNEGSLALRVSDDGNVMKAASTTGRFADVRWIRVGFTAEDKAEAARITEQTAMPAEPAESIQEPETAQQATPETAAPLTPDTTAEEAEPAAAEEATAEKAVATDHTGAVHRDCVGFDPRYTEISYTMGQWRIVEGNRWLFSFGNSEKQARDALRVIRHYYVNQSCYVGRPDPSFRYLLKNNKAPEGMLWGEDCVTFNISELHIESSDDRLKMMAGNQWLFDFASNPEEAQAALELIRKYRFNRSCYIGRPKPSFTYLRR